jgi:hypothetical protein
MAQRKPGSPEDVLSKFTTDTGSSLALLMLEKQRKFYYTSGNASAGAGADGCLQS